jgi:hypothetical protein
MLLRLRYFKLVPPSKSSTTMKAQASPRLETAEKAKPKPKREPPVEEKPPVEARALVEGKPAKGKQPEVKLEKPTALPIGDILGLTVAQIRSADLSTSNIGLLIEQESARTPRPRTTVLRILRVEQRRQENQRRKKRRGRK